MKKIGIATVHTGFNYGSCLQAYAGQIFIANMGYETVLLCHKESMVKGRDIRVKKIIGICSRTILRPSLLKKTFLTYKKSLKKEISDETKQFFLNFQDEKLNIKRLNRSELIKFANDEKTLACVCGSDQIWNTSNIYIDPIFYLRFAPKCKRVAYAPSLGKDFIPNYNKKIMKKYISDFNYISVREEKGAEIIDDLIGKKPECVLDPTLMLNHNQWLSIADNDIEISDEYLLLYFLDKPTEIAIKYIDEISNNYNLSIIAIPYAYEEFSKLNNIEYKNAGPAQFIRLINNASVICTDSFHGMIFSINFNKNFYIFERNYGVALNQSSRIESILNKVNLIKRFIKYENKIRSSISKFKEIDFENVNDLLEVEREKSMLYLKHAFLEIESKGD